MYDARSGSLTRALRASKPNLYALDCNMAPIKPRRHTTEAAPSHSALGPVLGQSGTNFNSTSAACLSPVTNQYKRTRHGKHSLGKVFRSTSGYSRKSISNWFNNRSRATVLTSQSYQIKPFELNNTPLTFSKTSWHPSLEFIFSDPELSAALLAFATSQYNEENILFLQAVRNLSVKIQDLVSPLASASASTRSRSKDHASSVKTKRVDFEILSMFNQYIEPQAAKQVNLSSACFHKIMAQRAHVHSMPLPGKQQLFGECESEIERLVSLSILSGFYNCNMFQHIAHKRPISASLDLEAPLSPTGSSHGSFSPRSPLSPPRACSVYDDFVVHTPKMPKLTKLNTQGSKSAPSAFDLKPAVTEHDAFPEVSVQFVPVTLPDSVESRYMISRKPLTSGCHEWSVKILQSTHTRQEIGIVSRIDEPVEISNAGIWDTKEFGARAVYGHNGEYNFYYASYNKDNSKRCNKDLSELHVHKDGWKPGDVITVRLNLDKGKIKFYLNDKQVRRTLSVAVGDARCYYPILFFPGNVEYNCL